ncbi:MAG: hypothetical protein LAO22_03520 [Acidobacteriia bacterium]|nr:hypothetical protein [Terriglobia bacterium]
MSARSSCFGMSLLLATSSLFAQSLDPAIAPMAPPNAIPEGTTFLVRLEDKLDTTKLQQGKHFKAKLAEDLTSANGNVIPRGKKIKGHVSSVEQGLHARILLSFDEIETNHGWVPLIATVTGVPGEHGVKTSASEGEIERKGMSKKHEIEAVAVGAAIGTVAGAAAGGGKGAGIGAGAGAGVGALVGLLSDHDLRLEKGTTLEVRLDHALQVPSH